MADTETTSLVIEEEPKGSLKRKAPSPEPETRCDESPKRARRESSPASRSTTTSRRRSSRSPPPAAHDHDDDDNTPQQEQPLQEPEELREQQQPETRHGSLVARDAVPPPRPSSSSSGKPNESVAAARARIAQEERKRGQRLWGGLVGALTQRPNSVQQKRADIDKRIQDRARAQRQEAERAREEKEKARAERRARVDGERTREMIVWEEQLMRVKHRSWREAAGFLKTRAEPAVFYLPWTLTKEQKKTIRIQEEDVEEDIRRDLAEFEAHKKEHIRKHGTPTRQLGPEQLPPAKPAKATPEPDGEPPLPPPAKDEEMNDMDQHEDDEIVDVLYEGGERVLLY